MKVKTPLIIAEAGVNHNGSPARALEMVDAAAAAGADYIKFQTFVAKNLVTNHSRTADYQKKNCDADSQLEMLEALELSHKDFIMIRDYCRQKGIGFLSTPFDSESIAFLAQLGMDYMKVPSGEVTNLPYLREIAATGIPAIISTGMCTVEDIAATVKVFREAGYSDDRLTLLHCTTEYPAPLDSVNLRAMVAMSEIFAIKTGYSDHTRGIEIPVAATALGAAVIEKHFTLSRSLPGPDHAASLEPDELAQMVKMIRNVSVALGSDLKTVTEPEARNIAVARKSIVALKPIKKGEIFTPDNLTAKRPGTGISPMHWDIVIGTAANRDYMPDDLIQL